MMKRREVITLLGNAAVAWPLAAHAQQSKRMPRIGVLLFGSESEFGRFVQALSTGMAERGYREGKNVHFEVHYSDGNSEKLKRNARELAAANVDVIWVPGSTAAEAAREATAAIPIVFAIVSDPIRSGFVRSLASPGTNMTGLSLLSSEMWGKRLELLLELRAGVQHLGVLAQPGEPASQAQLPHIRSATAALGKDVLVVDATGAEDFAPAFRRLKEWGAEALFIVETGLFLIHRKSLIDEALKNRWPTVNSSRQYAEAGGLIAYGVDYLHSCRRSAEYVDRILKGARPSDLPVQQPTKFELIVNLKTAKVLGLTIPESFLARADEVIE
jgi:putative tryptophan/tyrosine transport system substrate-binding protein